MKRFRDFYITTKDRLFGYLLRKTGDYQLAADTMQESFTRYLERYGTAEPRVALLFTISRHVLVDIHRKQRHHVLYNEEVHDRVAGQDPSLVNEQAQRILQAISQLPPEDADILSLVTGSNLSYREIASMNGMTEANVKVRVHRSRLKLRQILESGEL